MVLFVVIMSSASVAVAFPLSVDAHDPDKIKIKITPQKSPANGLLELLDINGQCVQTVYAGSVTSAQDFILKKSELKPGNYTVRYRDKISLVFEENLLPNGEAQWINPVDLCVTSNAIYVLDALDPKYYPEQEVRSNFGPKEPHAYIYKFSRDGKPDLGFCEGGRFGLLDGNTESIRALAVDEEGMMYVSNGYHLAVVYDQTGSVIRKIGGYSDPHTPKCTIWVNSLTLAPPNKIYLPSQWGSFQVYDRTREGYDGALYSGQLKLTTGFHRMICVDAITSAIYVINRLGQIERYEDTGTAINQSYVGDFKFSKPTGTVRLSGFDLASLSWRSSFMGI